MDYVIKTFALTAATILVMGLVWNLSPRLPRFPWDLRLDKFGFTLYVPFISALIVSAILTMFLNFFGK